MILRSQRVMQTASLQLVSSRQPSDPCSIHRNICISSRRPGFLPHSTGIFSQTSPHEIKKPRALFKSQGSFLRSSPSCLAVSLLRVPVPHRSQRDCLSLWTGNRCKSTFFVPGFQPHFMSDANNFSAIEGRSPKYSMSTNGSVVCKAMKKIT